MIGIMNPEPLLFDADFVFWIIVRVLATLAFIVSAAILSNMSDCQFKSLIDTLNSAVNNLSRRITR